MNAARAADDPRFAAAAQRTGAAANDEECYSAPSSAAPSGNANTRPKPPLYLASERRDNGTVVTLNLASQVIPIAYDHPDVGKTETVCNFNRPTSIIYPVNAGNAVQGSTNVAGAGGAGATNITYSYGVPGAPSNAAGRIIKTTSQMGIEERQYGKLGETVYEKKTVNTFTSPLSPEVYETRFAFDTFGRMLRMTYPDGEVLTYTYDSGGNLRSASGEKAVAASGQNHRYQYLHKLFYDKFEQRVLVEQGNGVTTVYTYDAQTRRLDNLTAQKNGGDQFQNLLYTYDKVGNITDLQNQVAVPPPSKFGGPTQQHFNYDALYRLTSAFGTFQSSPQKTHRYDFAMQYDSIHNITQKTQAHGIIQPSGTSVTQKKTTYDFAYAYNPSGPTAIRPHAPNHIGDRAYTYDANGNQTGWTHDRNGTRRTIVWDEENRIQSLFDNGHEKTYKYDDQGNRAIKRGPQGETVYVNQFFTSRPGANGTKHVYAGTTRIASKLMRQDVPNSNPNGKTPFEKDLYFYHPDHLGTSNYITDLNGKLYEHLEYFPFGEAWVEENSNTQRTPYLFTAKELDEETGLYYFGARYYDPRTSVWQSGDPILEKYLPNAPTKPEELVKLLPPTVQNPLTQFDLPGIGGIYNSFNMGLYGYSGLNPLKFVDPDGNFLLFAAEAAGNLPRGSAERIARGQLAAVTTAVVGTAVVGGVAAAPVPTAASALRAAPLLQKATALASEIRAAAGTALLTARVAADIRVSQALTAVGGGIARAETAVRNFAGRVSATAQDTLGRVLSSPVATNPEVQTEILDVGAALIPGTPPPTTPLGQAVQALDKLNDAASR